jgi:hypothetical protein
MDEDGENGKTKTEEKMKNCSQDISRPTLNPQVGHRIYVSYGCPTSPIRVWRRPTHF